MEPLVVESISEKIPADDLAYVCLCANPRAIYPTLVMHFQLQRIGAYAGKFVALASSALSHLELQPLIDAGIELSMYEPKPLFAPAYFVNAKSARDRDRILWQKLRAWNMTKYRKIVMLDVDMVLLRNFDELFEMEQLAGVPTFDLEEKIVFWEPPRPLESETTAPASWRNFSKVEKIELGWTGLNGGVMLLEPNQITFNNLIYSAGNMTKRTCCPTQEFLFRFFELSGLYHRLPAVYNLRKIHRFSIEEQAYFQDHVKIYHFVEKTKPILMGKRQSAGNYYAEQWWLVADTADRYLAQWASGSEERIEIARRVHSHAINPTAD